MKTEIQIDRDVPAPRRYYNAKWCETLAGMAPGHSFFVEFKTDKPEKKEAKLIRVAVYIAAKKFGYGMLSRLGPRSDTEPERGVRFWRRK